MLDSVATTGTPAPGELLETLLFLRSLYRLRGPDDATSVISVDRALTLASHRFEILRSRDRHLDALRRLLRS